MINDTLDQIETTVRDMWNTGVELVASGANRRSLIEYATGCYWALVNMQHAMVFCEPTKCDVSAMWSDAAAFWLAETLGM